ncbi:hypothetical protein [Macrococcus equipercicus]|uniref:Uncharacterized protein n=1 Tax=Macrococcus equipercicus TaxID=69967 RepID=A0A9Q9BVL8_9STAP|nr:hypothetical protein [Macrococcus equipercicus]UTH14976.1 hypothetical protein KFV11_11645 [Macrococcus equipercicus]
MRIFTEKEIEKYNAYAIDLVGGDEDIKIRCHICGDKLSELNLPGGLEKKVVCLNCREHFVTLFEDLEEMGEI